MVIRSRTYASLFIVALFALIAFLSRGRSPVAPDLEQPIRIQLGGEPSTLDPARAVDQYGFGILRNVIEGLFTLDAEGNLKQGLAADYQISNDGLEYRFKLDPEAKWSDGEPVQIEDFILGLRHGLNPKTASPSAEFLFAIDNARAVFAGEKPVESLGVERMGDELVIRLERPDPAFLMELTLPVSAPLRKDMLEANQGRWSHNDPVTGDYQIKSYRPAEQIELIPNSFRREPAKNRVIYRIFPEEVTAMNLFESGHLDVISTITTTEIARLKSRDLIQTAPSTTVFYFSFNFSKAPFNDPTWRKAVAASVDRKGLEKILHGAFAATTSYLPPSLDGHHDFGDLEFKEEVEKIRALKTKPVIRVAYGGSAFTKIVSEKVQQDLQVNLGIQVSLEPMELKTLLGRLRTDPPEMYFLGMSAMFNDPVNHLGAFSSAAAPNFSRYVSPAYEALLEKIRSTPPGNLRTELTLQAQTLLVQQDVVVVPMVNRLQVFGVSKGLKNFQVSPYQAIYIKALEK